MTDQLEKWKTIEDYPNYEVSVLGNVRSKKMMLKQQYDICGYKVVKLNNGKKKNLKVHRLVALAFIPNPLNKPQVNHKNGIKTDNRVENLEWATAKENVQHQFRTGLSNFESMSKAQNKLKKPVLKIKNGKLVERYESRMDASRKNNINKGLISYYCRSHTIDKNGYEWRNEK